MAPTLAEMFSQEFQSFKTPPAKQVAPVPKVGEPAPQHEKLKLDQGKPTIIVFLRHCGCPCKLPALLKHLPMYQAVLKQADPSTLPHALPQNKTEKKEEKNH